MRIHAFLDSSTFPAITWFFQGAPVWVRNIPPTNSKVSYYSNLISQHASTLILHNVYQSMAGTYTVLINVGGISRNASTEVVIPGERV